MAIDQFVPEFWSSRLRRHLDALLVYASPQTTNRNYEGEITGAGDTVRIFQIGDGGTIKTYVPNTDMAAPERPDGNELTLVIDQLKYYNVALDDVNRVQAHVELLDAWAERTARNLKVVIDSFVGARMLAGADAGNHVGSDAAPIQVLADGTGDLTPYEFFVELRRKLNAAEAPENARWAVIDEDFEAKLLLDPKYIEVAGPETRSGEVGRIAGFSIARTTAVPTSPGSGGTPTPNAKVIAGAGNYATTVAHQLTETKAYEIEKQFGDGIKGLEVYGAKIIEPETLAVGHVES